MIVDCQQLQLKMKRSKREGKKKFWLKKYSDLIYFIISHKVAH